MKTLTILKSLGGGYAFLAKDSRHNACGTQSNNS